MRSTGRIATWAILLAACVPLSAQTTTAEHDSLEPSAVNGPTGSAALIVENRGQFDPAVKYKLTTRTCVVWITDTGLLFDTGREDGTGGVRLRGSAVGPLARFAVPGGRLDGPARIGLEASAPDRILFSEAFAGSNSNVIVEPGAPSPHIYDYFTDADAARLPLRVSVFPSVDYKDVWPGISAKLIATGIGIERQFIVQPGANAGNIAVSYQGAGSMTIDAQRSLLFATALGTLREAAPNIYQEVNGNRIAVGGQYRLTGLGTYGFQVDTYARDYPLVISSTILYSHRASNASTAPVVEFFDVAPTSTLPGQAAIGTLLLSGATSATVNGLEANCLNGQCGGTFLFYPTSATDYILQASGAGGNVSASQQVAVGQYQPNPNPLPAGLQVTWQGACWLKGYPKAYCDGACQGMAFTLTAPTPLPLEATLYLGTTKCNPASQDNLNDLGTLTGSGGWIFWFDHHPNRRRSSAIWTIGNQSSGCVSYATAGDCP